MGRKGTKMELYRQEREAGLTCVEIAKKYGVSRQAVNNAVAKYTPHLFHYVTEKGCVYVNLREWMNKNKVGITELARRLGYEAAGKNLANFRTLLAGRVNLRKETIDKLIAVTGLPYEVLFWEG